MEEDDYKNIAIEEAEYNDAEEADFVCLSP